jgi:hypothetical protein
MSYFQRARRLAQALAAMAGFVAAFAVAAPAAFAQLLPPGAGGDGPVQAPSPPAQVHVVTVGGMPGWQITLIAVVAALAAAATAVLLDRARLARRRAPATSS